MKINSSLLGDCFATPPWNENEKQEIIAFVKARILASVEFDPVVDTGIHLEKGDIVIQKEYVDNKNHPLEIPTDGQYANKAFRCFDNDFAHLYKGKWYEAYLVIAGNNVLSIRYRKPVDAASAAITALEAFRAANETETPP